MRTITLSGSPRERGRCHGESLRKEIQDHFSLWADACRTQTGMEPLAYLEKFRTETDFLSEARRVTPDLVQEVEGIAEGAALPFELVLVRQLSDEEPWYRRCLQFGLDVKEYCSTLGFAGAKGRSNLISQNMDTPRYYNGFQLLTRIKEPDGETEALVFTITGKLSLCGMNNHGMGICCNSLPQMAFDRTGLAEDFIVRRVLQLRSVREAEIFLRTIRHASGQNYLIAGPDGMVDLECSANKVVRWDPAPETRRVWHTNHPMVNDDTVLWDRALSLLAATDPKKHAGITGSWTTYRRMEVLERKVRAVADPGCQAAKDILADKEAPLCLASGELYTLGTIVMECDSKSPRMEIAVDPVENPHYGRFGFGPDQEG